MKRTRRTRAQIERDAKVEQTKLLQKLRRLIFSFTDTSAAERLRIADQITAEFGESAIPILVSHGLSSPNSQVRAGAIWTLYYKFSSPRSVKSALRQVFNDPDGEVRYYAVLAYSNYGVDAVDALDGLGKCLADDYRPVVAGALFTIAAIGPAAHSLVPQIVACIESNGFDGAMSSSEGELISDNGAKALGAICSDPERSIPVLRRLLAHRFVWARLHAAEALGKFGPEAECALDDMFIDIETCYYGFVLGHGIGDIGEAALPRLLDCLKRGIVSAAVLAAFERIGAGHSSDAIIGRIQSDQEFPIDHAQKAVAYLGEGAISMLLRHIRENLPTPTPDA